MSAPAATRSSARDAETRVTPMMAQYMEIKAANPDCLLFYRMGDFYELFFADAEIASRSLGIVLTKRGKHLGDDIPMCGVPVERADDYLQRLIGLGHRVAVCEQTEDPAEARKRGGKSVVQRGVVRLVTPGTITEDRLLEPGRANAFLTIARVRASDESWSYGLAAVDISTGAFILGETTDGGLAAEIARIEPSEIVVGEAIWNDDRLRRIIEDTRIAVAPVGRDMADGSAERRLTSWFGVATLDGFGALSRAEIAAASMALIYVERTQIGAKPALAFPTRFKRGTTMEIDAATRANLELTRTLSGHRDGSLIAAIDMTVTPAGGRLLAERLAGPLTDPIAIAARAEAVAFLLAQTDLRDSLRTQLRQAPDFARSFSRLALGRGGPRDLAALRDGLNAAAAVSAQLQNVSDLPDHLRAAAQIGGEIDPSIAEELQQALAEDLPLNKRDGGFIAKGFEPALDETRALRDESRRVIAGLQARYSEIAGTKQLKIKHNNFLGFFIEVQQAQGEKMLRPPFDTEFIHRQTMADAMRFSTRELGELEAKIASAADRALALELEIFERLAQRLLEAGEPIKAAAQALATIDVAAALAELAEKQSWSRPTVDDSLAFVIEGARHPVVEISLRQRGEPFVANDCTLAQAEDANGLIAIITGPNMAGKSTYLRQNALIAILAQIGSFVPARSAHIGIVDRLFSRVGAADDLARGRSTFMVEMVETAAILNQAGERSFVILDEIGRGTATFDGLSIAWAAVEFLHARNRARTLFATHFHELTQLTKKLPRLINLTMRVTDWNGEVVFLHEVVKGAADRSYGIQVARLAGLPQDVVDRAQAILAELEADERRAPVERMIDDLPLFAIAKPAPAPVKPKTDDLRTALDALNPDDLSPREALDALYALKKQRIAEDK
ncbi:MAG TPA: DNA mismatch repair protein MutS [Beijerinckiaceae bacterium]|jgi:DNA mismatch repair protein MutS|nr:DNA mismatch repair protein MutS [Beijerinckiaceae bacterium]